jgi:hypothetical protein
MTAGHYPMIPRFTEIPGETPNATGTRALAHAIVHGTATIHDEGIEQAIRVATLALAAPGIAATAADSITGTVHALRAALRHRKDAEQEDRAKIAEQLAQMTQDSNGGGGTKVPAHRTPPPSYPPAPAMAALPAARATRPQHAEDLF